MAQKTRTGFARFWNAAHGACFDVLDGPAGNDATLRPNQILAVSLPVSALSFAQQRAVVDICERELLVDCALRTLAPAEPGYRGRYVGPQIERDAAYHQGTAWQHISSYGLGSIAEICDGDAPFSPRGCFAQAWSVAEMLHAWTAVSLAR